MNELIKAFLQSKGIQAEDVVTYVYYNNTLHVELKVGGRKSYPFMDIMNFVYLEGKKKL